MAIVICAIDNLGKGAAGQAMQNANLALGLAETAGLRLGGRARMSVTAAKGFVASGVAAGIRRRERQGPRGRPFDPRAVGAAVFTRNRVQAACLQVTREHLALADPQAVVINSGVANAATGERGKLDALATAAEAARLLDLRSRGGARALDRRDRRAAAAAHGCCRRSIRPSPRSRPRAAPTPPRRS